MNLITTRHLILLCLACFSLTTVSAQAQNTRTFVTPKKNVTVKKENARVSIKPRSGPGGTRVQVSISNANPGETFSVSINGSGEAVTADRNGVARTVVTVDGPDDSLVPILVERITGARQGTVGRPVFRLRNAVNVNTFEQIPQNFGSQWRRQ